RSRPSGSRARSRRPPGRGAWAPRTARATSRRGWRRGVPRLAPAGPCSRSSEGRSSGSLLVLLREDGVDLLVELLRPLLHAQLTSEDLGDHVALDLQPGLGVRGDRVGEAVLLRGLGEDLEVVFGVRIDVGLLGALVGGDGCTGLPDDLLPFLAAGVDGEGGGRIDVLALR